VYLTAQRVVAVSSGDEGINAFHHRHAQQWNGPPPTSIPDTNPGKLVNRAIEVAPGGNSVRSYLDIIAPEATPWSDIREALVAVAANCATTPFPWSSVIGNIKILASMDPRLSPSWQSELALLYQAILRVRVEPGT
jgi:hypothetical protein